MGERKKAVEHLVASHKHGLAAISRKIMHVHLEKNMGRKKYLAFNSNICHIKWRRNRYTSWGKMGEEMGKKI